MDNFVLSNKKSKSEVSYMYKGQKKEALATSFETAFFERDGQAKEVKCKHCSESYICVAGSGYSNVKSHLAAKHSGWEVVFHASIASKNQNPMDTFVKKKPKVTDEITEWYAWMLLVVQKFQPFSIIEDPIFRAFRGSTYKFSRRNLRRLMDKVGSNVNDQIKLELSSIKFGLLLDSWDAGNGTHMTAVFASYTFGEKQRKKRLLFFTPLINETSYSAESYFETLKVNMRDLLDIDVTAVNHPVLFIVGDNVRENYKLGRLLKAPMIGCFSHRLNLCCKDIFEKHIELINRFNHFMITIVQCKTIMGIINTEGFPKPIKRNETRWLSTFAMLQRSYDLFDYLPQLLADTEQFQHFRLADKPALKHLIDKFEEFRSMTVELQSDKSIITISVARQAFTNLLTAPEYNDILEPNLVAKINPREYLDLNYDNGKKEYKLNNYFQSGITKIQLKKEGQMNGVERDAVKKFLKPGAIVSSNTNVPALSLLQAAAQEVHVNTGESNYVNTDWIDISSDCCERLFSIARLVNHYTRKSMTPESLEICLYLWANKELWNDKTVAEVLNSFTLDADSSTEADAETAFYEELSL
jgi:hypothetical protein